MGASMRVDIPLYRPIDCDIHPAVPDFGALLPFLDDYWREAVRTRGIHLLNLDLTSYPPTAPLSGRPDWRSAEGVPGSDLALLKRQALDHFGSRFAICNVIHAAQALFNADMAAAFCRAINDWVANELLDRDPRLRASIVIPWQDVTLAVAEIERRASDPRFVQVLMLVQGEIPLGRRLWWPIYEAAQRHGLTIGIHAGSIHRHAPTPTGWPSSYLGEYVAYGNAFEPALLSLIVEGVFVKYPKLKVVLLESGVTWLPAFIWRANKTWRGVRAETPWVSRPPGDYVREHVRLTIQPLDAPPDPDMLEIIIEQLASDKMLLFATDYPHWHYDGDDVLPAAFARELAPKILFENALDTYPRLNEAAFAAL
jgi:predicted TIM-barrel fold metal-dependent hydrolase